MVHALQVFNSTVLWAANVANVLLEKSNFALKGTDVEVFERYVVKSIHMVEQKSVFSDGEELHGVANEFKEKVKVFFVNVVVNVVNVPKQSSFGYFVEYFSCQNAVRNLVQSFGCFLWILKQNSGELGVRELGFLLVRESKLNDKMKKFFRVVHVESGVIFEPGICLFVDPEIEQLFNRIAHILLQINMMH